MIRTLAVYTDGSHKFDVSLKELKSKKIVWYWVDLAKPDEQEKEHLKSFFEFNDEAIQYCLSYTQRPKMEYYDEYRFIILQSLQSNMDIDEIDLFLSGKYIVTFCLNENINIEMVWKELKARNNMKGMKPEHILYYLSDEIVDKFFPMVQKIEDDIEEIDELGSNSDQTMIDGVKAQLSKLSKLRKTVKPTKDLMYRIINSTHVQISEEVIMKLRVIYDHLEKLLDDISDNREMANDIRESYISTNSHKMNRTMKTLTSVSIVFMPLTFVVGIYGMNFDIMPELHYKYGYYVCWGVMLLMVAGLVTWFKKKDWF